MSHALASIGMIELVICGTDGAETIALDRDGNRIDPSDAEDCGHCSDCLLTPMDSLPEMAGHDIPSNLLPVRNSVSVAQGAAQTVARARARGPPAETES
ncbi:hypothetical protein [Maritimibacter fusiformis]|jgi:hypothetical protein|nr:hypothetical protein [Maritimibacter fusiformis]